MYCKHCGEQIADDAKFCAECGKPVSNVSAECDPVYHSHPVEADRPTKKKKPGCFVSVLLFFLLIGGCGAMLDSSEPSSNAVSSQRSETLPSQIISNSSESHPASTVPNSVDKSAILETAVSFIRENLSKNFAAYDLTYDETGITVSIWGDGIATGAYLASTHGGETLDSWNKMLESFVGLASNTRIYLDSLGLNDVVFSLNILNDQNKDNVLAMVINDVLVYDAVSDSQ